jgi:hypothetical protein
MTALTSNVKSEEISDDITNTDHVSVTSTNPSPREIAKRRDARARQLCRPAGIPSRMGQRSWANDQRFSSSWQAIPTTAPQMVNL